ncbi:MAG: GC-type dockerin domain-anchored protein [Phycisphaerales bacterium]
MNRRRIARLTSAAVVLSLAGHAAAQARYDFILVDSFNPNYGLRETYLWDINDAGVACGITTKDNTFGYPGIIWDRAHDKTIVPVSYPRGVSNTGIVVGNLTVYDTTTGETFNPPLLPQTYIGPNMSGVNDAGVAVGMIQTCNCSNSGGTLQIPYVWDKVAGARTIGVPNAKGLLRINNSNVAIGWLGGNSSMDGFFIDLDSGAYTLMNSVFPSNFGTGPTRAYDINEQGAIVGTRYGTFPISFYGYLWSPSTGLHVLPFPPAGYQKAVRPLGLNNDGIVVGDIFTDLASQHAFIFTGADGVRDLNDPSLVDAIPAGFTMMSAQKISNHGWIIGYGYGGGGMYKSFVLVPKGGCPADFNADGFVNGDDYDAFASFFDSADPAADFNHDGFVNGNDYDAFAEAFDAGC